MTGMEMKISALKKRAKELKEGPISNYTVSEYKIVSALRIKDLIAKRLCLNEKEFSDTPLNIRFIVSIIGKKREFSIKDIRLDLINGVSIEETAIRYCEPVEVILEIIERDLKSENDIVSSKIYISTELTRVFNKKSSCSIHSLKLLREISEHNDLEVKNLWWTGEKILKNHTKIISSFLKGNTKIVEDKKEYISISKVPSILGLTRGMTEDRIRKKCNIFGVIFSIIKIKKHIGSDYKHYALLADIEKAKENKKYYVKHGDIINYAALTPEVHKILKDKYRERFSKEISFSSQYIKKETLHNFIELVKECGYYKKELIKNKV